MLSASKQLMGLDASNLCVESAPSASVAALGVIGRATVPMAGEEAVVAVRAGDSDLRNGCKGRGAMQVGMRRF